jgi:hypothetical protein
VHDQELTLRLADASGASCTNEELAPMFSFPSELTEWSFNPLGDARGTLRVSVWTRDTDAIRRGLGPEVSALRDTLAPHAEYEGLGFAYRADAPPTMRWWALANHDETMAAAAANAWPQDREEQTALLASTGGPHTCTAVGIEDGPAPRRTIYASLRSPAAALRVLELASVTVSKEANLFWKGIVGLVPGGRPWPKLWVGRSFGLGGGWKFYYFARGDEYRRSDEVLLDAIGAGPQLMKSWRLLRDDSPGPVVQLIGLTCRGDAAPTFTAYLARR